MTVTITAEDLLEDVLLIFARKGADFLTNFDISNPKSHIIPLLPSLEMTEDVSPHIIKIF